MNPMKARRAKEIAIKHSFEKCQGSRNLRVRSQVNIPVTKIMIPTITIVIVKSLSRAQPLQITMTGLLVEMTTVIIINGISITNEINNNINIF